MTKYRRKSPDDPGLKWHTEEGAEAIRQLYIVQGLKASLVAKMLGLASHNVAIGLAHRRGWVRSAEVQRQNQRESRKRPEPRLKLPPVKAMKAHPMPPTPSVVTQTDPKPFVERRFFSECAFIVSPDGADAMVCAAPIGQGSYCRDHARLCWQVTRPGAQRVDRLARIGS